MKRRSKTEPPKVSMVVDTMQGRIVGWEMPSGEFVPIDQNCCANPFECTKCFGPVDEPWWARWWR